MAIVYVDAVVDVDEALNEEQMRTMEVQLDNELDRAAQDGLMFEATGVSEYTGTSVVLPDRQAAVDELARQFSRDFAGLSSEQMARLMAELAMTPVTDVVEERLRHGRGGQEATEEPEQSSGYHKTLELGIGGIQLHWTGSDRGGCAIQSELHEEEAPFANSVYNAQIDGIESMILNHFSAGVDVTSEAYRSGLQSALDALGNNCEPPDLRIGIHMEGGVIHGVYCEEPLDGAVEIVTFDDDTEGVDEYDLTSVRRDDEGPKLVNLINHCIERSCHCPVSLDDLLRR